MSLEGRHGFCSKIQGSQIIIKWHIIYTANINLPIALLTILHLKLIASRRDSEIGAWPFCEETLVV